MRSFLIACVLLSLSCAQDPAPSPPAPVAPRRPNILLVTIDTVRADHTSLHGYERDTTPFLEELAAEGVRFDRAYATSSWTVPSMASLLTSLEPREHGVTRGLVRHGQVMGQQVLSPEHRSLAEELRGVGYRTVGITANAHLSREFGFAQGFDHYVNLGFADGTRLKPELHLSTRVFLGRDPWFLWVHFFDPHGPYTERSRSKLFLAGEPGFDAAHYEALQRIYERDDLAALDVHPGDRTHRYLSALYDGEIRYVDDEIRSLVDELKLGAEDMIVVTADHGEEFFDHGDCWHGHTLYEETIRVPLVVRLPGRAQAGSVVDHPVSLTGVMPTILKAAGVASPSRAHARGLFDTPGRVRASLEFFDNVETLIESRFKYIHNLDSGEHALYDIVDDPGERANLVETRSDIAEPMRRRLEAAMLSVVPFAAGSEMLSEEQLAQLRALGYVR